jgi:hypothetical protein
MLNRSGPAAGETPLEIGETFFDLIPKSALTVAGNRFPRMATASPAGRSIPRAFTGVTQGGKQAVVVLTGLPIDRIQRRDFLIWLCRNEEFTAYAYATQVGVADDNLSGFTEALDIYASSDRYDVSQTLSIDRQANGAIQFFSQHHAVLQAKDGNGVFFGLQRSNKTIPSSSDGLFQDLWRDLKSKAMWRQR